MKKETKIWTLVSPKCVNSNWSARFLAGDKEYCQCSFKCKVRVIHKETNQEFIIDEEEYNNTFKNEETELSLQEIFKNIEDDFNAITEVFDKLEDQCNAYQRSICPAGKKERPIKN